MNVLVIFSLIMLAIMRILGFWFSLDFYLKTKNFKFKVGFIGWILWTIASILPLLTSFSAIYELLLFYNLLFGILAILFLGYNLTSYFIDYGGRGKIIVIITILIVIICHLLLIIFGTNLTISTLAPTLNLVWLFIIITPILKWSTFRRLVDKTVWYMFFILISGGIGYIPLGIIEVINGYDFGLYKVNDILIIGLHYGYFLFITIIFVLIIVHIEYKITENERRDLKDKYSHNLGNALQAINTSLELLKLPNLQDTDQDEIDRTLWSKLQDAADMIKNIREL
jgi:hypothetical protein